MQAFVSRFSISFFFLSNYLDAMAHFPQAAPFGEYPPPKNLFSAASLLSSSPSSSSTLFAIARILSKCSLATLTLCLGVIEGRGGKSKYGEGKI